MNNNSENSKKSNDFKVKLKETNSKFYCCLQEILTLDPLRSIPICTLILNLILTQNYFPWLKALYKKIPSLMPIF